MEERNNLFPIFLKAHQIKMLIIGGGNVAEEKLTFLLKSSPDSNVTLVAKDFKKEVIDICYRHDLSFKKKPFEESDLTGQLIVIVATDDKQLNTEIYKLCRAKNILVNVADTPETCDFYLGGIVTKENLKIAISTNGKSPTMAKRLRQMLEQELPESMGDLLNNMNDFRKTLSGDFTKKMEALNKHTKQLISNKND